MEMTETVNASPKRPVWNAGGTFGAKRALKPRQIWEIRFYGDSETKGLHKAADLIG
ncbi:hypothetical protein EDF58_1294 [Novosphingobium sp. PhB57]|nr:hypothetical protein EDF58_1294 [Novosphingobium sp. PhB57]